MTNHALQHLKLNLLLQEIRDELADVCAFLRTEDEAPFTPLSRVDVQILYERLSDLLSHIAYTLGLTESEGA